VEASNGDQWIVDEAQLNYPGSSFLPSPEWVRSSVTRQIRVTAGGHFRSYGFQWKLGRFGGEDAYWAAGWGGQYVVVFPRLNLVFVQTAGRYSGEEIPLAYDEILEAYVLPATKGR
jgi:CubicO group peptidase (beta-lactamase class C family)